MTSKFIPNSFQVPNAVIDDLMSQMSGAELKCYLAVIRKTKGWNKEEDAISITQLMEVTGLSNRKVIDACNSLVKIGLLNQKTGARNTKIFSINWCKKFTSEESSWQM
ncbi:TPA: replication protein [Pasteurella multocida]